MRLTTMALLCSIALSAQDPFLKWMDQIAQQQLTRRESAIAEIRTPADANRRRRWVRAEILEILGGLPDYQGPLNARITGRLTNVSYTMEKVIFESLPRYFVTANLYRPNQPGRLRAARSGVWPNTRMLRGGTSFRRHACRAPTRLTWAKA